MSAWTVLTAQSTAPSGSTAWLHLNSQAAGTVIVGGRLTALLQQALSVNRCQSLSANAGNTLLANVSVKRLTASIGLQMEATLCR